jgi:cholesterol transport system auxiliary component
MLYRDQSYTIKSYTFHQWRANPGNLVQHFLIRDLRASGLYKAILPYSSRSPASYVLEGSLDEFLEWDEATGWKAVLSLSMTLINPGEKDARKRIVMQKDYRTIESCRRKNPQAVAEAMSLAMSRVSEQIGRDIYTSLKDNP